MTTRKPRPLTPRQSALLRYIIRSRAIYAANHPTAVAAHADYVAGMTWTELEQKHGLSDTTLRAHWKAEGLPYQTGRRKVNQ